MKKTRPIDMPIMPSKCPTCPFRDEGFVCLREETQLMVLTEASRICHHHELHKLKGKYLCRGARDFQLRFFHAIGFLSEPTDEAWAAKYAELWKSK
jgi:hypothetical protein